MHLTLIASFSKAWRTLAFISSLPKKEKKKKKEGDQKEVSSNRRVNNPPFFFPALHPLLTKPCVDEESRNALRVIIFFTLKNLTGNYFLFQLQGQKMDSCLI